MLLDAIFPPPITRVVFVDADNVVRGDLRELIEEDMRGAPLAMVPFCEQSKEMQGYRFWQQGFWKDHLRGLRYHISALFVVDLEAWREGAGDRLRAIYNGLAQDPNSLSNLDQDLPNYAQVSDVPIHSLPREWLYCHTWCEGEFPLSKAKSVDLCNNPASKEPKLEMARRILGDEWIRYDEEIAQALLIREGEGEEGGRGKEGEGGGEGAKEESAKHDEL